MLAATAPLTTRPRAPGTIRNRSTRSSRGAFPSKGSVLRSLGRDKLLAAVDGVGRAGQSRVAHDVGGQRGDVSRFDDASDWERGAQLVASLFEVSAEQRRRERRVDEAGGDQVGAYRCELQRQIVSVQSSGPQAARAGNGSPRVWAARSSLR